MFGLFKKKAARSPLAKIIELDDSSFVRGVKEVLEEQPPMAWAMCVVAFQNLPTYVVVGFRLGAEKDGAGLPRDFDGFIRLIANAIDRETDELSSRRFNWIFSAALIQRASEKAANNHALNDDLADIWIMLARGAGLLKTVFKHNMLWSDSEKEWFAHIRDERSGISYGLNQLMPGWLREHPKIESFAEGNNIWLSIRNTSSWRPLV